MYAMNKLSVKTLIDFHRKTIKGRQTLINNLRVKTKPSKDGGDYWISCVSTLSNAFKSNDNKLIKEKIAHLVNLRELSPHEITKTMYERNARILRNYEDYDFSIWHPSKDLKFQPKTRSKSIVNIKGLPIQVLPSHVFSFNSNGIPTIGAIWFVAKLNGFKIEEVGIFTEILYRYLDLNYASDYLINPSCCVTIDVVNCIEAKYDRILNKEIPSLLDFVIDDVKTMV